MSTLEKLEQRLDNQQANIREWYDAFTAMRNDINEIVGDMGSQEANLEPGMGAECAAVVKAVAKFRDNQMAAHTIALNEHAEMMRYHASVMMDMQIAMRDYQG